MKFAIAVNMERRDPAEDMREVAKRALTLVQIAEQGGFEMALAAEHHTIEFQIAPNPFSILTHWAAHTSHIRLGIAVVQAAYWHPIRLAGEAALADVLSDGRLEFGIGRGAFQYEFDRLAGGIKEQMGVAYMKEVVPAVRALWRGDYEHRGEFYSFPSATSVPKPLQKPEPPIWVAARDPGTFDWAIRSGFNIMSTPLSRPPSEVRVLGDRFRQALADNPAVKRPRFLMQRRTSVYEDPDDWNAPVAASIVYARGFENLFKNIGTVTNGFPRPIDIAAVANRDDYNEASIRTNFLFGTPDEAIEKLELYRGAGVDVFSYGASFGLDWRRSVRSLELFIERVMPAFAETPPPSEEPAPEDAKRRIATGPGMKRVRS
jgi:alkanesulfonate monooxygenase SsuD/methylene tetrahydromethanopterin reductase-like flavin-dependent oxidoreductase (luciferase family)